LLLLLLLLIIFRLFFLALSPNLSKMSLMRKKLIWKKRRREIPKNFSIFTFIFTFFTLIFLFFFLLLSCSHI